VSTLPLFEAVEDDGRQRLSAALEAALLRALQGVWATLNANYFRGTLRAPAFVLADGQAKLGEWRPATRTIALARGLVVDRPWGVVIEVLKHEVAHQYVSEALGGPDAAPHGPSFQTVCARLGIDARAAGLPLAAPDAPEGARVLGRVAKLLALAESQNRHEAESAMARAQELMLKHNLEAPPGRAGYAFRHLGEPTGRVTEAQRLLANLLADQFFVEVIWVPVWRAREGKRGTVLEVCGTPVNLEMAEHAHDFLLRTADRLWLEYARASGARRAGRQSFLAGVMTGFAEKLRAQARASAAAGLVWVGDADLARYHRKRHPYVRRVRYAGNARDDAHASGRAAGRGIVLSRPVESGGAGGAPRLLRGR
jgi:hypothetical protein